MELYTRARQRIDNEQVPPRPPEAMQAAREGISHRHPGLRVRSLDSTYNCVGMVFANRRTWIEPDELPLIFADDGYKRLTRMEDAVAGDIAVYRDSAGEITHVGVIIETRSDLAELTARGVRFQILSQWGRDGEYLHDAEDVDARLGRLSEIWSERRGMA